MSLIDRIKEHEGLRLKPYRCTAGKLTIGYGRNIEDRGVSREEAEYLLMNDVADCKAQVLKEFSWSATLDDVRRGVLIEMCFQLGINRLSLFTKMLNAVRDKDYNRASAEMINSAWHKQTPKRCERLAQIMMDGEE